MNLMVNGKPHTHTGDGTLTALMEDMQAGKGRVAAMVNGKMVPRRDYKTFQLQDGDRIELLVFAGGG